MIMVKCIVLKISYQWIISFLRI